MWSNTNVSTNVNYYCCHIDSFSGIPFYTKGRQDSFQGDVVGLVHTGRMYLSSSDSGYFFLDGER